MNLRQILIVLRERHKLLSKALYVVLILLVAIGAWPAIVDRQHAHTVVEKLPAFWAAFGLVGVMLIYFISKACGDLGIERPEDYYDE